MRICFGTRFQVTCVDIKVLKEPVWRESKRERERERKEEGKGRKNGGEGRKKEEGEEREGRMVLQRTEVKSYFAVL
jgi:hypothetical protein